MRVAILEKEVLAAILIGFVYRQSRADRDDFLENHWDHIKKSFKDQFDMVTATVSSPVATPFDFDSLITLSPSELIEKLIALIPPRRSPLAHYSGVFEPNFMLIDETILCPGKRKDTVSRSMCGAKSKNAKVGDGYRARLLRRVFSIDVSRCPHCGAELLMRARHKWQEIRLLSVHKNSFTLTYCPRNLASQSSAGTRPPRLCFDFLGVNFIGLDSQAFNKFYFNWMVV